MPDIDPGAGSGPEPDAFDPRAAALAMAALGAPVFPCHTPRDGGCSCGRACGRTVGKHPRTANGLSDANANPAMIRRWWRRWPDANVAVRTGAVSRVIVVDIEHDAFGALEAFCNRNGAPGWSVDSWTVVTGGGGLHLYLAHPGPDVKIKTTAGILAPGVDIRADGGYALIPPSLHASRNTYRWADGYSPWQVGLAPIPPWLLPLLVDTPRSPRPANTGGRAATAPGAPIPEGQRNTTLASLAGSMRRHGFGEKSIAAALAVENAARCRPPLDAAEVATIAASVTRYAPEPEPAILVRGLRVREVRRA